MSDTTIINDNNKADYTDTDAFSPDSLVDNNSTKSNCLALTVRKDYSLIIVKNVFTTTGRLSWKIALTTTIINILNILF